MPISKRMAAGGRATEAEARGVIYAWSFCHSLTASLPSSPVYVRGGRRDQAGVSNSKSMRETLQRCLQYVSSSHILLAVTSFRGQGRAGNASVGLDSDGGEREILEGVQVCLCTHILFALISYVGQAYRRGQGQGRAQDSKGGKDKLQTWSRCLVLLHSLLLTFISCGWRRRYNARIRIRFVKVIPGNSRSRSC